jgi:hypothetical protein
MGVFTGVLRNTANITAKESISSPKGLELIGNRDEIAATSMRGRC